jgi:hypothetical protein
MKRVLVIGSVVLLGALNWAALHDILKGEPDLHAEWAVVICTLVLAVLAVARRLAAHRR